MLLSLGASGFLLDEFAFGRCNNKNLVKFAEINNRCNVSGTCQVIGIYFYITDISDKESLKKSVADMRSNDLFSNLNIIIIISKIFTTDSSIFHLF